MYLTQCVLYQTLLASLELEMKYNSNAYIYHTFKEASSGGCDIVG